MIQDSPRNVSDNRALLDLMISDWRSGSTVPEVTGDLIKLYESFIDDLKKQSLRENISKATRGLTAVNGCDHNPTRISLAKLSYNTTLDPAVKIAIETTLNYIANNREASVMPYDLALRDLDETAFRLCEAYGQACGAPPLREIEMSAVHYPDYTFDVGGKSYSYVFLYSYLHYAYCSQFVDFGHIENVIEIGGGVGRQLEVTKKLNPHLKFYMVDLGPTLYACHQYLSAMFPDAVLPYEQTRTQRAITIEKPGQIAFVGNWQLESVKPKGPALSFNTAVFCIMEPKVVQRYLSALKTQCDFIYLMEPRTDLCASIYHMPSAPTYATYEESLQSEFTLVDRTEAIRPLSLRRDFGGFDMMMWIANRAKSTPAVRSRAKARLV